MIPGGVRECQGEKKTRRKQPESTKNWDLNAFIKPVTVDRAVTSERKLWAGCQGVSATHQKPGSDRASMLQGGCVSALLPAASQTWRKAQLWFP